MPCSFCKSCAHTVRQCPDPYIDIMYAGIKELYITTMNEYPDDIEIQFKEKLHWRFSLKDLRAVCVVHTNFASFARTKEQTKNSLYLYFSNLLNTNNILALEENKEQRLHALSEIEVRRAKLRDFLVVPPGYIWWWENRPLPPMSVRIAQLRAELIADLALSNFAHMDQMEKYVFDNKNDSDTNLTPTI